MRSKFKPSNTSERLAIYNGNINQPPGDQPIVNSLCAKFTSLPSVSQEDNKMYVDLSVTADSREIVASVQEI